MKPANPETLKCRKCGRATTSYRALDNSLSCRYCGYRWNRKTGEEVNDEIDKSPSLKKRR